MNKASKHVVVGVHITDRYHPSSPVPAKSNVHALPLPLRKLLPAPVI